MCSELFRPKIITDDEGEVVVTPGRAGQADDSHVEQVSIPDEAAVLPVRGVVLFPSTVMPLPIGRERSRRLIHGVLPTEKIIIVVCQKDPEIEEPGPKDLYDVGTATMILKLLRSEEDNRIIITGLARVAIEEYIAREPYLRAKVRVLAEEVPKTTETEALVMNARTVAQRILKLSPNIPDEAGLVLGSIEGPGTLADFLASNLPLDFATKQQLLEELRVDERLRRVIVELQHQLEVLELSDKIQSQVRANID